MSIRKTQQLRGTAAVEQLSLVVVVAMVGLAGLSTLGSDALRPAIAGAVQSGRVAMPVVQHTAVAVGAQAAGLGALRDLAEIATRAPRRAVEALRDYRATRDLLTPAHVIPWESMDPALLDRAVARGVKLTERRYERLASPWIPRTASGTVRRLENIDRELNYMGNVFGHLEGVLDSEELTAAFNRFDDVITEFENRISNHEGLWKRYKRIEGSRSARRLEGEEARAFAERMQDLRREGADLPAAEKARLSEIRLELSELGRTFAQNVSKDEKAFEFFVDDASKLDGLSELYVKRARESAEGVGKPGYRFTIFDGTATEAMSRVHDPAVREALWRAMEPIAKTGETDNYPLAVRILELRREMAQLLGYDDFSDLATETRMVKNGAAAEEFIDALAVRTKEAAQAEFDELRAFRRSVDGIDGFEPWDGAYWSRKFADTRVDSEVLRKYFPLDNVLEGFFRTTEQIYGVKFEELSLPTWHPDVRSFQVVDATGRELGILQLDLYSRPGKRGGAWHHSLNKGAGDEPTMSVIATNFDPPGADGVVPPIRFRQVETVFHEFGHALHGLFSETKLKSHGGTAVARDFVELPSQIMENFAWEDDVLAYLAKHHETGAALPDELLSALKAERTAGAASAQMRQLALSKLDLALHRHYNPAVDGDIAEYAKNLLRPFVSEGSAADPSKILPEFEHIFSGSYASGYYGYKWAEVLDADAYTRFKADGVLSRRVGDDFRRTILSRGGSEDADQLYRDFMGRDPDLTALLRRLGIDASAAH